MASYSRLFGWIAELADLSKELRVIDKDQVLANQIMIEPEDDREGNAQLAIVLANIRDLAAANRGIGVDPGLQILVADALDRSKQTRNALTDRLVPIDRGRVAKPEFAIRAEKAEKRIDIKGIDGGEHPGQPAGKRALRIGVWM